MTRTFLVIVLAAFIPKTVHSMDLSLSTESSTDGDERTPLPSHQKITFGEPIPNYRTKVPEDRTINAELISFSLKEYLTDGDGPIRTLILTTAAASIADCHHLAAAAAGREWFAEHAIDVIAISLDEDFPQGHASLYPAQHAGTVRLFAFFLTDPKLKILPKLVSSIHNVRCPISRPKRGALFIVDGILKGRLEETDSGNLAPCSVENIITMWKALLEIKKQRLSHDD